MTDSVGGTDMLRRFCKIIAGLITISIIAAFFRVHL